MYCYSLQGLVLPGWKLLCKDFSLPGIPPNSGIGVVRLGGSSLCRDGQRQMLNQFSAVAGYS